MFHLPYPVSSQGLKKILDKSLPQEKEGLASKHFDESIIYSQKVGNIYTGSLFLGLCLFLKILIVSKQETRLLSLQCCI